MIPPENHRNNSEPPDLALPWRDTPSRPLSDVSAANGNQTDETSTRELYSHLINLLTQEAPTEAKAPGRSPMEGVLMMLRRRWLPMLLVFGLAAYPLARALKPKQQIFTSSASILLPPPNKNGGPSSSILDDGSDTAVRQYDTEAQIAIITSPKMVRDAMSRLKPEDRLRGWGSPNAVSAQVTASAPISENIIDISVTGLNPRAVKNLANTVAGVYIGYTASSTTEGRTQNFEFVNTKVKQAQKELDQAKRDLQNFKEESGILDLPSQLSGSSTNVQSLQQQAEVARAQSLAGTSAESVTNDLSLNQLRQQAAAARTKADELLLNFLPTAPRVQQAEQEWRAAQQAADQRAASLVDANRRNAAEIEGRLSKARQVAQALPAAELRLGQLNSRVVRTESTYKLLSDQFTALSLARNAHIAVPTYLRPATVEAPSRSPLFKALAISVLGSLILAALTGFLLERLDRGVHSAQDLSQVVEAPILGMLPAMSGASERRLTHMSSSGAGAAMLESCYKLRSNLVEAAYKNGVRSLLLTSATTDEGKSLCALNVAASLAYDGHRVLLVDGDFWNPTQHMLADVELSPGYSDLLSGEVPFDEAVRASNIRNLWILPSGKRPANIVDLINGNNNRQQLKTFKETFDFVIVDSPPTLSLSDAQVLSSLADAVALVVAESTAQEEVQRAQAVLRLTGGRMLGVILNKDKSNGRGSRGQSSRGLPFEEYQSRLQKRPGQLARLD